MYSNPLVDAITALGGDVLAGEHPTLKAMAAALGVPAQRVYSVAKQPVEGREYNAKEYNWDAIHRFVARRLEGKFETMEEFVEAARTADIDLQAADGRRRRAGSPKAEDILLPDGTVMPGRRAALEVGQTVYMRGNGKGAAPASYTVVMLTDACAVLQEPESPVLRAYSNWTLNQKLITEETYLKLVSAGADPELE